MRCTGRCLCVVLCMLESMLQTRVSAGYWVAGQCTQQPPGPLLQCTACGQNKRLLPKREPAADLAPTLGPSPSCSSAALCRNIGRDA